MSFSPIHEPTKANQPAVMIVHSVTYPLRPSTKFTALTVDTPMTAKASTWAMPCEEIIAMVALNSSARTICPTNRPAGRSESRSSAIPIAE